MASVTIARYRPLMRIAGTPTSIPTAKHSAADTGTVAK